MGKRRDRKISLERYGISSVARRYVLINIVEAGLGVNISFITPGSTLCMLRAKCVFKNFAFFKVNFEKSITV